MHCGVKSCMNCFPVPFNKVLKKEKKNLTLQSIITTHTSVHIICTIIAGLLQCVATCNKFIDVMPFFLNGIPTDHVRKGKNWDFKQTMCHTLICGMLPCNMRLLARCDGVLFGCTLPQHHYVNRPKIPDRTLCSGHSIQILSLVQLWLVLFSRGQCRR